MSRLWLYLRAVRALWRVGILRIGPFLALRIWLAWRQCRASLAFLAEVAALRAGSRVALVDDDGALTFAELRLRYRALAAELVATFGSGPGRQIAVIARNHRNLVVALLAATRSGADVVLLNPDSPPSVLAKLLDTSAAVSPLLILHESAIDLAQVAPGAARRALDGEPGCLTLPRPVRLPPIAEAGRLCVLTAGSTGVPKRVARRPTLAAVLPALLGLADSLPLGLYQPTLVAVPCFHGHGLATLAAALAFAAPVHLARRYEIAPLLARCAPAPAPVVVSVPTLLRRWLASGPTDRTLAAVLSGSAPLEPALCRRLLEVLGPVVYNLYGSTEAGLIALATPAMLAEAPGTVGRPLPGTEVRILDPSGGTSPGGRVGRLRVRGPLVAGPPQGEWLDTGDLGNVDQRGHLHVCGRSDGMFVSGGENVYPQEVEARLLEHPVVAEAAIAVVPDDEFGARMCAFVVIRPGERLSSDELRAWLRDRLDRHQQPKSIGIVDALPRNLLGKLDRSALNQLARRDRAEPGDHAESPSSGPRMP